MKTILIATDFSIAAHNACLYGIAMARAFHGKVILFNAYQNIHVPVAEPMVHVSAEDRKNEVSRLLDTESQWLKTTDCTGIEKISKEGPAAEMILKAAKDCHAEIIITGMKTSGGLDRILGSTVTTLIRRSTIPLIIVPGKVQYTAIGTIALANESDMEPDIDVRLLSALRSIVHRFSAKLYLVRIARNKLSEAFEVLNPPFRLMRLLKSLHPVYECIEGKNIPEALNSFIDGYHVDMLAMLPHKQTLLEKWFLKSTTRTMAFEARVPLLILPDLHTWHRRSSL